MSLKILILKNHIIYWQCLLFILVHLEVFIGVNNLAYSCMVMLSLCFLWQSTKPTVQYKTHTVKVCRGGAASISSSHTDIY